MSSKLNNLQKIQNSFGRRENERKQKNECQVTSAFLRFTFHVSRFTFSRFLPVFLFGLVILLTLSSLSATFAELIPITLKHGDNVYSVAFSPDGKLLATGTGMRYDIVERSGEAKVWEMPSGKLITILKHDGAVLSVSFSPDGNMLATGSFDNTAKVWEMPNGKLIATLEHDNDVYSVAFSPDGNMLATGTGWHSFSVISGKAQVWEMPSGKLIAALNQEGMVTSASFSPDGKLLATTANREDLGFSNYEAKVWEMPNGKLIATMKHDGAVYSVSFSPDGKMLATGSGYTAKVWEMPNGKLIATLKHDYYVRSVSFSPDGKLLATGSLDNTARVWEMPNGKLIATLKHDDDVYSVTFSPDGKLLATGSYDNTAKVWAPNTADIPKLTQPPDGSKFVDALPELKWNKMSTLWYQVQVARDKDFSQVAIEASTETESLNIGTGQLASGAYFWRVRTVGWVEFGKWLETRSFELVPPPVPALVSPANKTDFSDTLTPTLKWEAVQGALSYGVQVAEDEAFKLVAIEQTKLTQTSYAIPVNRLEVGNTYYWRVNASNATCASDWSTPWLFTTPILPLVLYSPRDKEILKDTLTPRLGWQGQTGAKYSVQIAKDESFTALVVEEAELPQSWFYVPWGKLENGNTYYWRVNASNVITGDWSATWSFTLELEREPPSAFDLSSPANGTWTTATPTFFWAASKDTGLGLAHYQLWMDGKLLQDLISKTSYTLTNAQALSSGFHTWTVKAVDKAANITQANQTWTVKVDANAPEPFALLSPEQDYQTRDADIVFSWQGSSDAETGLSKYQLYVNGKLREDNIPPANNSVELAPLFSIGLSYQIDLDNKNISGGLRQELNKGIQQKLDKQMSLSQDVVVSIQEIGSNWRINDRGNNKSYLVKKDKDKLNIYYMPNGAYSWYIVAFDKVGYETRSVQERVFHILPIDIILPTAPMLALPADEEWTANTTPEFRWNASTDTESGLAKYQFWLDGALLYDDLVELTVALDAEHALSNGAHQWFVKAIDKEGNTNQSKAWTVNVDILPPEKFSLKSPANGDFADILTPNFSWQSTRDLGVGLSHYQLYIDGELNRDKIPPDRTTEAPSAALTEGQHRWFIKAVDKLGNVAQSSETWTVFGEWNPPQAFNLISPTNLQMAPGPRPALSWEPSIDTGAGIERYELWIGGKLNRTDIPPTRNAAIPANDLSPGPYQWFVKAVDKAGNATASKATWTFIVKEDLTLPTSTITQPVVDQTVGGAGTVIKGTAFPHPQGSELANVEVSSDGGRTWKPAKKTSADFSAWEFEWTNYTMGYYTLRSRAVDKANNVELPGIGVTVYVDLTPPKVSQVKVTPSPAKTGNILVDVAVISEAAQLNYGLMPTVTVTPAGGTPIPLTPLYYRETKLRGSAQLAQTVENGTAVVKITSATDQLGNVMLLDESHSFVIDTQPPSAFNLVEPADGTWLFSKHPNFRWESTDDTGTGIAEYHLIVDGKLARTTTKTSGAPDFELVLGEHTWSVNAIDKAGNVRTSSSVWRFSIDATAPVCAITAPLPRTNISDRFYLVQGIATDGAGLNVSGVATVEVSINDGDWQPAQSTGAGFSSWTYGWGGFKEGAYTIRARAIDRAGNVSAKSEPALVTVDFSLPGIESITVTPELAKPGDTVTITLKFIATAELNYAVSPAVILMTADGTPLVAKQESYKEQTWVGSLTITANVADGIGMIYVSQVVDVDGRQMFENPSAGRLAIDTTPPNVQAVSVSPDPAKAGSIVARVMFADAASGVDTSISPKVAFIPQGGGKAIPLTQIDYDTLTQTWTGQAEVTADMNDGLAVITAQGAVDKAGNLMPLNDAAGKFTIDVSPPVAFELVSPADDSWLKGDAVKFTWAASSDKISGLASYWLYLNGSLHQSEIPADQTSIVITPPELAKDQPLLEGAYMWQVEAVDIAGNAQSSTSTWRFGVDNTPPQTTLTISESKLSEDNALLIQSIMPITLAADDGAGSGVALIEYRFDDGKWIAYAKPFTVNVSGDHKLYYRSSDKVGNVEAEQSVSIRVEVVTPTTPWDVNNDGLVDVNDLLLVGQHFGETIKEPVLPNPDVNGDGVVDIGDLALIGIYLGESSKTLPEAR
ncbi:hypothetical protein FJZ31_01645 [Candidatus Poribacteria bacterium]|nr:hypothetical protein [Candidatus Poribacteria bacterium]